MTPETIPLAAPALPSIALVPPSPPLGDPAPKEAPPATAPGLILFGCDERGRPHASAFSAADAEGASRAAALMGLHALAVGKEHHALATGLARGRLFASGKAFVPFCAAGAFARLMATAGLPDMPMPLKAAGKATSAPSPAATQSGAIGGTDGSGGPPSAPRDWSAIGIGSVVLACQGPMEGWWEAVVLYTKADDRFVLRWRDFPDDGEITRARKDLGLLPPGSREGVG
ncbi:hypothetical protein [Methylobacterium longum]|uniref:Uncharacterized protein n=1 Tax=Methylobacterium longum TaxID=767694 RepID=A0ABT8ALK4_9HYPH|nr:hypothetical protein [Methylobacterium longum]MDN3570163.1 hypothetical protein [Methylobacterium longum]GJE12239.1 hypothetical protein FOHLNKBM_3286 [Methylobacterium longum]